jgi:hypothetical protein
MNRLAQQAFAVVLAVAISTGLFSGAVPQSRPMMDDASNLITMTLYKEKYCGIADGYTLDGRPFATPVPCDEVRHPLAY